MERLKFEKNGNISYGCIPFTMASRFIVKNYNKDRFKWLCSKNNKFKIKYKEQTFVPINFYDVASNSIGILEKRKSIFYIHLNKLFSTKERCLEHIKKELEERK